jgi:hypothetical protein
MNGRHVSVLLRTCLFNNYYRMKKRPYYLGQVLKQRECLKHEFKEFCMKIPIYKFYETDELYTFVKTGVLDSQFNQVIESNLQIYFKDYVPKYASAYSHCRIDTGILSFGINDFGEITGIPYMGELSYHTIKSLLRASLKYIRGSPNTPQCRQDYIEKINVKIIPLDTEQSNIYLCDVSLALMEELNKKAKIYEHKYKEYLCKREAWLKQINLYSCSLDKMIRHKKTELFEFIRKRAGQVADKIIQNIEENYPIVFDFRETEWKENKEHYIYWLFEFKDTSLNHISAIKPQPPIMPKIFSAPTTLMTQLSDMRLKFLNHNPHLKYYLIQIHFPGNIRENYGLEYFQRYKHVWVKRHRTYSELNEPCCQELPLD